MRIAIVGGGAAGLMAAAVLKQRKIEFTLFERENRVGKKLLATGNGRCNITNIYADVSNFHGEPQFAAYALNCFGPYALMDFLAEIGIPCWIEAESGKVFPHSLQASAVLDMFRLFVGEAAVETEVLAVEPSKTGYLVQTNRGAQAFDKVIFACGGKAARRLSGGGSYALLTKLGYAQTPLKPAIVQLKCDGTKALDGIKTEACVTLNNRKEYGEVLFTAYGLSGPPILQVARDAPGAEIRLDIVPDLSFKEILDMLSERRKLQHLTLENLFTGIINKKLGQFLLKRAEVLPMNRSVASLTVHELKSLAALAKALSFTITDTNGFDNAQVTAGGISCKDFHCETMESKKHKGLYATGEMLNIDGDCGGFNLQWAFSSGYIAAVCASGGAV